MQLILTNLKKIEKNQIKQHSNFKKMFYLDKSINQSLEKTTFNNLFIKTINLKMKNSKLKSTPSRVRSFAFLIFFCKCAIEALIIFTLLMMKPTTKSITVTIRIMTPITINNEVLWSI